MTDRKFTPPTSFPAEYVDSKGRKVVILGRGPNKKYPLVGYDGYGGPESWTNDGQYDLEQPCNSDLHDIPKRITTWHNICANWVGPGYSSRSDADETDRELRAMKRLCVYRIERDEDGGNPEIFVEEAND